MLSSLGVTFVNLGIGAVSRIPKEGLPSSINPYLDNIIFNVLVFGANSLVQILFWVSIAHLQSQTKVGRLYNLTLVHFNPQKREFSLLLSILKHLAN